MVYLKDAREKSGGRCLHVWRFRAGDPGRTLRARSTSGRLATLTAFVLLVGGPASAAAHPPMKGNLNSVLGKAEACVARVKASPEYAPIRRHLKEADHSLMSDREIPLALNEALRVHACEKPLTEESFSSTYPSLAVIFAEDFARSHDNLVSLVRKRENWSDYVRRHNSLRAEFSEEFKREVQHIGVASAVAPAAAPSSSSAQPPDGKYACSYVGDTLGSYFFLGYLLIDSATNYHYTHAGHGSGTYSSSGDRLTFHSGPLEHEYGLTEGWKGSGSSHYYRLDLYITKNKSYASTCDGPHAK